MTWLCRIVVLASLRLAASDCFKEITAEGAVRYLSGCQPWTATSSGSSSDPSISIDARVPGDLLTDLQAAGQIGDPLYEKNWLNSSIWNGQTWTYSTMFSVDLEEAGRVQLVFDGIKMGAIVKVNGIALGNATSQFLRYSFDLEPKPHALLAGHNANKLEVVFPAVMDVQGRFMACSGGWDWAPYTNTFTPDGTANTFTKGIWRHVWLLQTPLHGAAISYVVPQIFYKGPYPTAPLADGSHGGFLVKIRIFLSAAASTSGHLSLITSWGEVKSTKISVPAGEDNRFILETEASAKAVKLWWPAGMGAQPLYDLKVKFLADAPGAVPVEVSRTVGFRYFALVTGNDTDPDYVARAATQEGTESHGMYFRVNGAMTWSRGANVIPMEELEGRLNDEAHRIMVRSAVAGRMNTLRVWGGGTFMVDAFYEECDKQGILVFHDMQYAQQGHSPVQTATQDAELRHQIRRLSSHTSIVIWDGCNECVVDMKSATGVYASFVMTVVAEEDASRVVWPSCPAFGWKTGVQKLDSLPNGNRLYTVDPKGSKRIEEHGYYLHGTGFPAVNGASKLDLEDPNIPINVSSVATGPGYSSIFASEFGAVVMSSFESMSPTLAPEHWGLHAGQPPDKCTGGFASKCEGDNVMAERNYPCDNIIDMYFGIKPPSYFNTTGEAIFKKQLFQCMLGQALYLKSDIETRRSKNELGCIVWQFNEIWPTGGWGSIEYGTPVRGQVIGGRWKPLQYFYRRSLFAEVMATCGLGGSCYVKNDSPFPFHGSCTISTLSFNTGHISKLSSLDLTGKAALPAGAGTKKLFRVNLEDLDAAGNLLLATCSVSSAVPAGAMTALGAAANADIVSFNEIPLVIPGKMKLPPATVTARVADSPNADGSIDIELRADRPALYVTLTTLAHGRFSDNAFAMAPGQGIVQFIPFGPLDAAKLRQSLRWEHLQQHQETEALVEYI